MFRFSSTRRLIFGIAAALLLLCQTAMAASACMPAFTQAGSGSTQANCHQPPDAVADGHAANDSCPSSCRSGHASFEPTKMQVYAAADLPLLTARNILAEPAARFAILDEPFLARAASPPLPIVLCRLLN
jgi:hypothetical protein